MIYLPRSDAYVIRNERNLCIATYYNLYGVMPTPSELAEMMGENEPPHRQAA